MLKEKIELVGSVEIADDVQKKVKTVGVRGLDFEKAKELGVFQRIGNLLTVMHATITAANRVYGHASYLMGELRGRRNDIAREMNAFEKAYDRFLNFWTDYYANGSNNDEVMHETENVYHRIMEWAQLPENWQLGEEQRVIDKDERIALNVQLKDDHNVFTFRTADADVETEIVKETWGVMCYDVKKDTQTTVYTDIDKASALMVAKRMSSEDASRIYTAAILRDIKEKRTEIVPFKAFNNNETIGKTIKTEK